MRTIIGEEPVGVIAGLDPAIHAAEKSAWTTGSSPVMTTFVMLALVAGIHVLIRIFAKDVDGRDKPGHDECHFVGWVERSETHRAASRPD